MSSDVMVVYNGQEIPKAFFRAYVYGKDETQMLMNSWEAYEDALKSGLWFSSKEDIKAVVVPKDVCSQGAEIEKAIGNMPKQRRK